MRTVSIPFRIDNGRVASTNDLRAVARQQIIDIVTTAWNERIMRPDYGGNVQATLFDPQSRANLAEVRSRITEALQQFLVIGRVVGIDFPEDPIEHTKLNISIHYTAPPDTTVLVADAAVSLMEGLS